MCIRAIPILLPRPNDEDARDVERGGAGRRILWRVGCGAAGVRSEHNGDRAQQRVHGLSCAIDRKLVGPSFQQVAEKYKGDAQALAKLAAKVKNGGSGMRGSIPMPSHPSMNDADIKTFVAWLLAGAPQK